MTRWVTWVWDDYAAWWAAYPPGRAPETCPGGWIAAVAGSTVVLYDTWADPPMGEREGFASEAAARAWVEAHFAELWEGVWP